MSSEALKQIYADEMRDLWSANDQMAKIVQVMSEKAEDSRLKQTLQKSVSSINKHAQTLKSLIADANEKKEQEHCEGMQGLVNEANKHLTQKAPPKGELLDLVIIAQYQRMCTTALPV